MFREEKRFAEKLIGIILFYNPQTKSMRDSKMRKGGRAKRKKRYIQDEEEMGET